MARGWESKSVEAQQAETFSEASSTRANLTKEERSQRQQKEGLMLARSRVSQQLESTQDPRYRKMLMGALADLDAQIAKLG